MPRNDSRGLLMQSQVIFIYSIILSTCSRPFFSRFQVVIWLCLLLWTLLDQYLFFLLKPENQELAETHGFRPASSSIPLRQDLFNPLNGVQYEIRVPIYKPLKGEVLEAILTAWVKVRNTGIG